MRLHHVLALGLVLQSGMYAKSGEIQIGGGGGFDYLTVDSAAKRLYVAHGTEVVVIDTAKNAVVGRIPDTPRVHGVAIAEGRGFITAGGENKVQIFDPKTLQVVTKVDTDANPDAITYDSKKKEIYALNHTGKSATVIDATTGKAVATVPLGGLAESGAADPGLGRVYVNIEDKNTVDVIDTATHKVVATWPVAPAEGPTGMAIDPARHRVFVGGGGHQVMLDGQTGKVVAQAAICGGTDATFFDPGAKMSFSSCSDGHITALRVDGDKLTAAQTIATARGARTMALDPATHTIYTAANKYPAAEAAPAAGAKGRGPAPIADSFHVLIFTIK